MQPDFDKGYSLTKTSANMFQPRELWINRSSRLMVTMASAPKMYGITQQRTARRQSR